MNVLVTGCSKGIGKSMVHELLKNSRINKVYITSTKLSNLKFDHPNIISVELDYLKDNWNVELLLKISEEPIHLLINNSGYLYNGLVKDTNLEEIEKMVTVNYTGPFKLVQLLLENLKRGKAHIINIGSMGGFQGSSKFPGLSIYSSSKAALANLSECWAEEFKDFGIRSNCLALGAVDTEMLKSAFPDYKVGITSDEVAKGIVNFALNYDGIINGKVIPFSESTP